MSEETLGETHAESDPTPSPGPLGARAAIARSFDLALGASTRLRPASIYIGIQLMALLGPLVILGILAFVRLPELGDLFTGVAPPATQPSDEDAALALLVGISLMVAGAGFVALSVDSQLIAASLLAGGATGSQVSLQEALIRSRQTFWKVIGASLLVGLPLSAFSFGVGELLAPVLGRNTEANFVVTTALTTLVSLPFVFTTTGIVLGEVGSVESVRRSVRLARSRWRLAFVVALFGAAIGYIEFFAIGAGGDVLVRVATTLGLGFEGGPATTFLTLCLLLAGLLAIGSLTFTIAALAVAPQVVSFLALTGYSGGLERAREVARELAAGPAAPAPHPPPTGMAEVPTTAAWARPEPPRPATFRWVSMPMAAGIVLSFVVSLIGIANVVGRV